MLNYSSFSLTYYHEERYSRANNGEAEKRSHSYFPEKIFAKFMPWNGLVVYNIMTGHYAITAEFHFVHTMSKLDLDQRRVQTRWGWTIDVDGKSNIYYVEGI